MAQRAAVTADTAPRLAHYLGTLERFWLGLPAHHGLEEAHRSLGGHPEREVRSRAA